MKNVFTRIDFSKGVFIFICSACFIFFFMMGGITILKSRIYSTVLHGESMEKTMTNDTKVLFIRSDLRPLKRGDIVSVKAYDSQLGDFHYLKRIIALPNEEIVIKGKKIFINGHLLEEPYAFFSREPIDDYTFKLKSDEYFIMGDNRCDSEDSRYIGPVRKESIVSVTLSYKKK